MKLPPLLDPESEKRVEQVVKRGTTLWLSCMVFALLIMWLSLALMGRSSPHLAFPVFFHFLALFLSSLLLLIVRFLHGALLGRRILAERSRESCLKRYLIFEAIAYFLVCSVMALGGVYVYLSGRGRDFGLFLSLTFLGFILYMPRKEELRSLLLSSAQGKASGAS